MSWPLPVPTLVQHSTSTCPLPGLLPVATQSLLGTKLLRGPLHGFNINSAFFVGSYPMVLMFLFPSLTYLHLVNTNMTLCMPPEMLSRYAMDSMVRGLGCAKVGPNLLTWGKIYAQVAFEVWGLPSHSTSGVVAAG